MSVKVADDEQMAFYIFGHLDVRAGYHFASFVDIFTVINLYSRLYVYLNLLPWLHLLNNRTDALCREMMKNVRTEKGLKECKSNETKYLIGWGR